MTYAEKLKDPRWQRKRLEIMGRDHCACRQCGVTEKTLNVHHINYEPRKLPWEYADADLITVCEPCHEYLEGVIRKIRKYLAYSPSERLSYAGMFVGCVTGFYTRQKELINGLTDITFAAALFLDMEEKLKKGDEIPVKTRKNFHDALQSAVGQFEAALANTEFHAEASQS